MHPMPPGIRYEEACLAKLDLPMPHMEQLNQWTNNPTGFLVILGNPGIGKTYFCAALANYFLKQNGPRTLYMTERDFLSHIRSKISDPGSDYSYEIEKMASYEYERGKKCVWMLDDIGSSQMTEWQKEVLQTFIDSLYSNKTPAIVTSNVWSRDMTDKFSHRFKSRLMAKENSIIEMSGQDKRELGL
jgi:DNA replication protein DnaC